MTLNEIYQLTDFICRAQDRKILPDIYQFNILIKKANLEKFKRSLGMPEEFMGAQPTSRSMYEMSQRITDSMRVFKTYDSALSVVGGEATLPADYFYATSISYSYQSKVRPVEVLTDAQWGWRQYDANKVPTLKFPCARFLSSKIEFLPTNVNSVQFSYLRLPATPVAVYTLQDGVMTYSAGTSTELEWDEVDQLDVVHLLLLDLGVVMDPSSIVQYAQMKKTQGV